MKSISQIGTRLDKRKALLTVTAQQSHQLGLAIPLRLIPHGDGVSINATPRHKYFRFSKWAKDCQRIWEKLRAGEHNWAHITYVL